MLRGFVVALRLKQVRQRVELHTKVTTLYPLAPRNARELEDWGSPGPRWQVSPQLDSKGANEK